MIIKIVQDVRESTAIRLDGETSNILEASSDSLENLFPTRYVYR